MDCERDPFFQMFHLFVDFFHMFFIFESNIFMNSLHGEVDLEFWFLFTRWFRVAHLFQDAWWTLKISLLNQFLYVLNFYLDRSH